MGHPYPRFDSLRSIQKSMQFYNNKNEQRSIQWDSNSKPICRECPSITTRPRIRLKTDLCLSVSIIIWIGLFTSHILKIKQ